MKKTVLIFSMFTLSEYEEGINNTNSNVFDWLKNRNDVEKIYFIDFNRVGFTSKLKYYIKRNVFGFPNPLYKLERKSDKVLNYRGITFSGLKNIVNGISNDCLEIWSFNPINTDFLNLKKDAKTIFYAVDNWKKNKSFAKYERMLSENYNKISDKASQIIINNKSLKEILFKKRQSNINFVPNGVNTSHYLNADNVTKNIKDRIDALVNSNFSKTVGYMGVITPDRVDFDLLEYCIKNHKDKLFVLAGPVWHGFDQQSLLDKYNNIRFIGTVYYQEFPYLFNKFDVCIIPHQINDFTKSMDTKKIYEFLASGKPIVTTKVTVAETFRQYLYMSETKEDFSAKIDIALAENSENKKIMQQEAVKPHDWQNRFKLLEEIIS